MSICPDGHNTDSSDYCDVCGTPMDAPSTGSGGTPAPDASAAADRIECPNCATENVANALFCEACGYDFTTGTMPRPWVSPFAAASEPTVPDDQTPDEEAPGREQSDDDSAPEAESPVDLPTASEDAPADSGEQVETDDDQDRDAEPAPPSSAPPSYSAEFLDEGNFDEGAAVDAPSELFGVSGGYDSAPVPAGEDDSFDWVAEVWVDPDWYRQQEPPDPMPSPGLPTVVPLRKKSSLVGRPSRSRGIDPDVDCDSDPGASRRQAQLTTDGRRWWVEDLDSANGTYVAGSLTGLPQDPLPVGERHELDPDDRIYLGAWTRLVIRRATAEEIEALD